MARPRLGWLCVALVLSCSKDGESDDGGESTDTGGIDPTQAGDGPKLDLHGVDETGAAGCDIDQGCGSRVDLLFVVDNSGSMSEEQLNLALNMPSLVQALDQLVDSEGNPLDPDVNIMVTTTDVGNPLCTPYYKPDRMPEVGAPIATPCTDRIDRFTGIGMDPVVAESACTDVCPNPIAPTDPFINFHSGMSNVPDADPVDVNGDGTRT